MQAIGAMVAAAMLALAALLAPPVSAALPAAPAPESEPAAGETTPIADTPEAGSDERIARRIGGIFRELPAFADVEVSASEGVVTLSGTVPAEEDIARAEAIAGRVSGVVTVENRLERDVSVDSGAAVAGLGDRFDGLVRMLPLIGVALAVWLVIALLGYLIAGLGRIWRRLAPNSFLAELIASAIRFVFVIGGLVVALEILGATALLGAVLGGAGLIGIALGFAMRDTIENYVASLMLSVRQPFRANDHVVIDGQEGRVIRLTSRATILMTLDGNHLRIPNGQVFRGIILNYTRNPQRRFDFTLGIDADDDPDAARQLGRDTLAGLPFVLAEPPPAAFIEEVGDSNILIRFLGWIDQGEADWLKARSRAVSAVKSALEDGGFALPEPIYRLRFDERSAKVPFEAPASARKSPSPRPPKATAPPVERHEDVAPTSEVAEMVDRERDQRGGGQENDLLDSSKPVE